LKKVSSFEKGSLIKGAPDDLHTHWKSLIGKPAGNTQNGIAGKIEIARKSG
jgi:hypothetical protein